jgi:hypothetical protein
MPLNMSIICKFTNRMYWWTKCNLLSSNMRRRHLNDPGRAHSTSRQQSQPMSHNSGKNLIEMQ